LFSWGRCRRIIDTPSKSETKAGFTKDLTAILKRHKAALVLVDINYMPHPADWKIDPITADFTYVRLIGDRKAIEAKTKTWDKIVIDRSEQLKRWAEFIRTVDEKVAEVFVFPNNHFAGHGPATIRQLQALLES
jgi:uncharacterized protein YecE (DUF72 family)